MDRLEALHAFCRIVELGSFSGAARQLGISNSSVTHQLSNLESHLGVRLLNRTTRKLSLTDEGRLCYTRAREVLADVSDLEEALRGATMRPQGVLRVDVPTAIGRIYIAPALPRFAERYPDLTVRMSLGDQLLDVVQEGIDVSIRIGELKDSGRVARTLHHSRTMCCASPGFLARHGVPKSPADLVGYPCLGFLQPTTGQPVPWSFLRDGVRQELMPDARIWINHAESLIHAAAAGGGIVQLLSLSLQPHVDAGSLQPILEDWAAPGPPISVIYPPSRHLAAKINAFVDFVRELFADAAPLPAVHCPGPVAGSRVGD